MRIWVTLKWDPEPVHKNISTMDLIAGKNIKEALKKLNITEDNFIRAHITIIDKETNIKLSFTYDRYDRFLDLMWYIRNKLKK